MINEIYDYFFHYIFLVLIECYYYFIECGVAKVMSLQNIRFSENKDISNTVIVKSIKVLPIQDKTLCILVIISPLFFQSLQLRIYQYLVLVAQPFRHSFSLESLSVLITLFCMNPFSMSTLNLAQSSSYLPGSLTFHVT